MGGGLMQLVAYGAQDIYLTGNPQITFFKVVYRRHTNFSMEAIEQTMLGTTGSGTSQTSTISRNGDLIHRMYFEVIWGTAEVARTDTHNSPGAYMVDNVELEIGGQMIDRHTGDWMESWAELTEPYRKSSGSVGNLISDMACMGSGEDTPEPGMEYYVPLQFWFCRNPGLALPLIALQYHEVKLKVKWSGQYPNNCKLYVDYIYLDTDERRRFAQVSHEYLIEQIQYQSLAVSKINELNFNHPVKELIWKRTPNATNNQQTILPTYSFHLTLNGHDRFSKRPARYFTHVQPWQYHSGGVFPAEADNEGVLAVYSFALKPEEHQPSGTCNFSRIDNAQLVCDKDFPGPGTIYAVNYNVLRIMSGMGGLAYSN